jgi:Zn-dependent protease
MSVYRLGRPRGVVRPSPLFLSVLAVTALGGVIAWSTDTPQDRFGDFGVFLFVLGGWVASVCLHEFAHAYAAFRAGDRSVEARGYLTLNPFKYTHPFLSILLPLIAIIGGGFALPGGAVYLHPHTFRTRAQRSMAAAAGPMVNVVLAIVLVLVAKNHVRVTDIQSYFFGVGQGDHARFWGGVAFLALLQITAAVLNLLPVPGLDGWAIIEPYLSPQTQQTAEKIKPWGMFAVLILLFYSHAIQDAFFNLVDGIYGALGGTEDARSFGYNLFRWWAKDRY